MKVIFKQVLAFFRLLIVGFSTRMPVILKRSACGADCEACVAPICLKLGLCFRLLIIKRLYQGISTKVIFEEVLAFLRLLIVGEGHRLDFRVGDGVLHRDSAPGRFSMRDRLHPARRYGTNTCAASRRPRRTSLAARAT